MLVTVWLFFILGTAPDFRHQAIDQFPSQAQCEQFRTNAQQMLDMGVAPGSHVTPCTSRQMLAPKG